MRLAAIAILAASPALAQGFAEPDLTRVDGEAVFPAASYASRAAPERLTYSCKDCGDFTVVDINLGAGDAGTEARYRSGETTLADMEAICQANAPECRMEAIEAGAAVGWLSVYEAAIGGTGSTAVLLRDGEMLTIRSISDDAERAVANARAAVAAIAPQVVGE